MNFVVIAAKRTGSSHFVNLLSSHPQVFCHGNVFKDNMRHAPILWPASERPDRAAERESREEFAQLRDTDSNAYLAKVFDTGYGRPHVGFKIFWNQNNAMLDRLFADNSIRKVVLYRANVLANYASARQAKAGGGWGLVEGKEQEENPPVVFDKKDFFAFHDAYTSFYSSVFKTLADLQQPYHLIQYDQINDPAMLAAVVQFIGGDGRIPLNLAEQPRVQVKKGSTEIISRFSNQRKVLKVLDRYNLMHWCYEEPWVSAGLGDGSGQDEHSDDIAG